MFRVRRPSLAFTVVGLLLAGTMVVLCLLPLVGGREPNYIGLILNLPVVWVLIANSRHAKSVVRIWAVLPIISLALYLLVAMHRGSLGQSPGPLFWLTTAAIGACMFVWSSSAFPRKLV